MQTKAAYIGGNGINKSGLSNEALLFIKNRYNKKDLETILTQISYDLELYNGFCLNIIWSKDRTQIAEIGYVDPFTVRIAEPDPLNPNQENYYVCDDWTNTRQYKPRYVSGFSTTDKKDPNQLLFVKGYTPNMSFYPMGAYLSAKNYIELENEISLFHLSSVKNGFHPSIHITLYGGEPTSEERRMTANRLKGELQGAQNAGQAVIGFAIDKDHAPDITPMMQNDLDDRFLQLAKEVQEGIFIAHRFNPVLLGVKTDGLSFNTGELLDAINIFQSGYVDNRQMIIEKVFNTLARINGIKDVIKLEKYQLKIDVEVGTADLLSILTSTVTDEQKVHLLMMIGCNEQKAMKLVYPNGIKTNPVI